MRIIDWSADVCSSGLCDVERFILPQPLHPPRSGDAARHRRVPRQSDWRREAAVSQPACRRAVSTEPAGIVRPAAAAVTEQICGNAEPAGAGHWPERPCRPETQSTEQMRGRTEWVVKIKHE